MKIEKYIPCDALKPFVKTFLIIESADGTENKVLPDTSIVMSFRLRGEVFLAGQNIKNDLPTSVVAGLRKSARLFNYSKDAATLLVQFGEGGAAALLKEPLNELFEKSVSLDDFAFSRHQIHLSEVEERLSEAKNNRQRISVVERFLVSRLVETERDFLIFGAMQRIRAANGNLRIKDLVKVLHTSRDSFEKRFRRIVGTSPKQFAAIVRLRNLIDNRPPAESLTDAALAAGYFDQAHFIKDFKRFTGQTPQIFFKSSAAYW